MGAAGAALGTVLAGMVNLMVLLDFIIKKKLPFVLLFSEHSRWIRSFIRQYLQKCFPIICNEVFIGVGNVVINIVLGHQIEQAIVSDAGVAALEEFRQHYRKAGKGHESKIYPERQHRLDANR